MAACHPKLNLHPGAELFLSRFAEGEWRGVVRPWLERGYGRLERTLVVAPTRGHTHALKRRCVAEGVPLLGVEFLTPGLARRKRGVGPGPARSLQLLVLRARIDAHLEPLGPDDPARLLWKSLASDLETALDDFESLVRGGFGPEDFPRPELRAVFAEMVAWMAAHGYALAPIADRAAALAEAAPGAAPLCDRMLILAGGQEGWREFFGLLALARRCPSVTVVVAEPEFGGGGPADEAWVKAWEEQLGAEGEVVDAEDPEGTCASVAELWTGDARASGKASVVAGHSRLDEMERVADAVSALLGSGADNIAVVFPAADAAHAQLGRILDRRGVAFADLMATPGTPPVDFQIQRAVVDFFDRGCLLEELLALWPLLRSLGLARITPARARDACQDLFDAVQSHRLGEHVALLEAPGDADANEVARVARLLLPEWPAALTLSDALSRFEAARDRLTAGAPAGWDVLREFAERAREPMPARAVLEAIRSFLPESGPAEGYPSRGGFAHVTLTTARRAAGIAWSHAVFVESNKGVWPERRESSCWLGDAERRKLTAEGRYPLGVATADERMAMERRLYAAIARDTSDGVVFSAAQHDGEDPEARLEPNAWLERVMWSLGLFAAGAHGGEAFGRLAAPPRAATLPPAASAEAARWLGIWNRRRDPAAPFDEHFFADPSGPRPQRLSAVQIERGIADPAELWFKAVLRLERVEWRPFERSRKKVVGTAVHRALAEALRGPPHEGAFSLVPSRAEAEGRLEAALGELRRRWPATLYWDSLHLDVSGAASDLLGQVYGLPSRPYLASEVRLPEGATIPVGSAGRIAVSGQMDLVLADATPWEGAHVDIVDYKTGSTAALSVKSMASRGSALQLGIYLEAARAAGAEGSVWMLRPGKQEHPMGMQELPTALAKLRVLGLQLSSGTYGALTADRGEFTPIYEWPVACAPIGAAILRLKFERTFGPLGADE